MTARWVSPDEIRTNPDLSLFPVGREVDVIAESMRAQGFDQAEPLVVWTEERYVVDGHQRLQAARIANLEAVYAEERSFESFEAALDYAIARQRDRRNLTQQELRSFIARSIEIRDRRKRAGERTDLAPNGARSGKSAEETAEKLGTSSKTVERVRRVLDQGAKELKQQLLTGEVSATAAEEMVREEMKKAPKPEKSEVHIRAEKLLSRLLANGPIGARELQTALKEESISNFAFELAKKSLHIVPEKLGATTIWKYAEDEEEIPRLGGGWECPTCGGYGWVEMKPKFRNPRGKKRAHTTNYKRAWDTKQKNGEAHSATQPAARN